METEFDSLNKHNTFWQYLKEQRDIVKFILPQ